MTGQERNYEAVLSHVLHTTTDQVEPVGDGLTKIRERLREPWLTRQWWLLRSEFMVLRWLVVVRCESLFSKLRSRSDVTDLTPDAAASPQSGEGALRSLLSMSTVVSGKRQDKPAGHAMAWFRPALAVAGAVVLVVAGVFALGSIRMAVGLDSGPGTSSTNPRTGTGNGSPNGSGSHLRGSRGASQGSSRAPSSGGSATHNKVVPASQTSTSPSPSPSSASPSPSSPSPSPSPTQTSPSPTPTQTSPSPTPSSSTSQAPLTGPAPGHSQESIGGDSTGG